MLTNNEKVHMYKDIMCALASTGNYKHIPDEQSRPRYHYNGKMKSDAKEILADVLAYDSWLDKHHNDIIKPVEE